VAVALRGDPSSADTAVVPVQGTVAALASHTPGVRFQEAGDGSGARAINQLVAGGLHQAELISFPLTLLILVVAFGAVVAACVPVLLGATSVAAALGALSLVSHISPNGSSTAPVVVLIGLAVGVDYSLFYIRRERAERAAGAGADAALDAASATVGRAILVAGATVAIALAGLLFTGFGVFTSMALGAIVVVAIAVVGSLTVLPAVLALLADRVTTPARRLWRRSAPRRSGRTAWSRIAQTVTSRPRAALALAAPVLADRGLEAAVRSLAGRVGPKVTVEATLARRPAPVVETAAYFVIAEALTNAAKHAPGSEVRVTLAETADQLVVEVTDYGPGGAVPTGSGLTGLRQRVEALDGRLQIVSPPGVGTMVEAVLPCAS
jgi:hypothetical protein